MQQNLEQLAEQFEHLDISGQMILPANTEDREQFSSDDSSEKGDYMIQKMKKTQDYSQPLNRY